MRDLQECKEVDCLFCESFLQRLGKKEAVF